MKTLYLDIFSGISGDMFLGAVLDLGLPFDALEREISKLDLGDFHIHSRRAHKSSIEGVKFDVHAHARGHEHHHHARGDDTHDRDHDRHHHDDDDHDEEHHDHIHAHHHEHGHEHHGEEQREEAHEHEHKHGRTFAEIRKLIQQSPLSPWVKEKAIAVFTRIARAEGKIHGQPADSVHFHEVGAVDSIVDIVGACVGLEILGKPRVLSAPVVEGHGWIQCAHGRFPIPAPATIAILAERKVPISQCDEPHELVTPTGAAILAEFVEEFRPMHDLVPEKIGYGLGERNNKTRPNVLRAILGRDAPGPTAQAASTHDWQTDTIAILETNLDDINSEILGYVVEQALAQGALDVFHTPIQMKKNRPGVLLTILSEPAAQDRFTELLLRETTALGIRRSTAERRKLKREIREVQTPFGPVEVKFGQLDGKTIQASPEFESCQRLAKEKQVPLKEIYAAALNAAASRRSS
ncbi:MAG TPA: nickel pincer cofactor biosynthesis protein LarC [Verrucomicrobiae bacterium]|nr:nickel pincer cofactor biosynthesis protein LarC [Verrucomicrobiae bacterium]